MRLLPRTLALTAQLIGLMLLVSTVLMLIRAGTDGWVELAVFAGAVVLLIWLWHRLRLQRYSFD